MRVTAQDACNSTFSRLSRRLNVENVLLWPALCSTIRKLAGTAGASPFFCVLSEVKKSWVNNNRFWVTVAYYTIATASRVCNTENVQKICGSRIWCLQRLSVYITQIKIKYQKNFKSLFNLKTQHIHSRRPQNLHWTKRNKVTSLPVIPIFILNYGTKLFLNGLFLSYFPAKVFFVHTIFHSSLAQLHWIAIKVNHEEHRSIQN